MIVSLVSVIFVPIIWPLYAKQVSFILAEKMHATLSNVLSSIVDWPVEGAT